MITKRRRARVPVLQRRARVLVLRRSRPQRRGAALYTLVMLTTILVGAIGLASLQLARSYGREHTDADSLGQARLIAQAALQLANQRLAAYSNWQNQLAGAWLVPEQNYGMGYLSVTITDPADGAVSGNEDNLLVIGMGQQGRATQKLAMQIERQVQSRSCLRCGLVAGSGIQASQSTVRCSNTIATSGDLQLHNSTVQSNVLVGGSVIGAGVAGTISSSTPPRLLPDTAHVLDYYMQNGTALSFSGLPKWQHTQILRNNSFESDTSSWYPQGDCNLSRSSARATNGSWSMRVSSRAERDDTAAQDITHAALKNGNTYRLSLPFFPTANGTASARLTLQSTGDGIQVFKLPDYVCAKNGFGNYSWIVMEGELTLNWSGNLTKATLTFDTTFSQDYYVDNVSLVDVTYPNNVTVIDRQFLAPALNTLGTTNAAGIYVINCGNQDLIIGRSRLVGTLVLLNPGAGSCIADGVTLEPASAGMPSLLVQGNFRIATNGQGITEAIVGYNLNPINSPYPYLGGTSNNLQTDNYPAQITGLVYTTGSLTISGRARLRGVVVAHESLLLTGAMACVEYDDQYLTRVPPGFRESQTTLRPRPASIGRMVD